jgi:hypothetical protein
MRYGIIEHHEDGDDTPVPYFVIDSTATSERASMLGPKFTRAEAGICAFGLTAVAEHNVLCAIEPDTLAVLVAAGYKVAAYDDSIEGVA